MFSSYSAAVITHCDVEIGVLIGKCNFNETVLRRETQRVIEEVGQSSFKQVRVGMDLSVAAAGDCYMMIVCDRLIKRRDFFDCCTRIESLPCDRFTRDRKSVV